MRALLSSRGIHSIYLLEPSPQRRRRLSGRLPGGALFGRQLLRHLELRLGRHGPRLGRLQEGSEKGPRAVREESSSKDPHLRRRRRIHLRCELSRGVLERTAKTMGLLLRRRQPALRRRKRLAQLRRSGLRRCQTRPRLTSRLRLRRGPLEGEGLGGGDPALLPLPRAHVRSRRHRRRRRLGTRSGATALGQRLLAGVEPPPLLLPAGHARRLRAAPGGG